MASIQDILNQDSDSKKREQDRERDERDREIKDRKRLVIEKIQPAISLYCKPFKALWISFVMPFVTEVSQVEELKARGAFISNIGENIALSRKIILDIYAKGDYSIHPYAHHLLNSEKSNYGDFNESEIDQIAKIIYTYHKSVSTSQIFAMLTDHQFYCDIEWHNEVSETYSQKEPENLMSFYFHSAGELAGKCGVTTEMGGGVVIGDIKSGFSDDSRAIVAKRLLKGDFKKYKPKYSHRSPYGGLSLLSGFGK